MVKSLKPQKKRPPKKEKPPALHPEGRPTLFSEQVCNVILNAVRLGAAEKIAPLAAGISYETCRNWLNQGEREGEGPHYDFFITYQTAKGQRVRRWLAVIEKATKTTWQAAAWKLERLYPDVYGRFQRIEHGGTLTLEELVGASFEPSGNGSGKTHDTPIPSRR